MPQTAAPPTPPAPPARPTAFVGARLVDPASGYDGPGSVVIFDGKIAEVVHAPRVEGLSPDIAADDCAGALLIPGLVDIRVKTGEPGAEPKETLKSAARAAAAGGVTSIVLQPDTDPVVDEPAVVDFILRRARDIGLVHVYPAGAATKGLKGVGMAEIGLMREAGAVYITDADHIIVDSLVMRRVMAYANGFGAVVAHRPADPYLSAGAAATEGEFAARLGLPGVSVMAARAAMPPSARRATMSASSAASPPNRCAAPVASIQMPSSVSADVSGA